MAPLIDYYDKVFIPVVSKFGIKFQHDLVRRGFFPKGGGEVIVRCSPIRHIQPIEILTAGNITSVNIYSHVAGALPIKIAERMSSSAQRYLQHHLPLMKVGVANVQEPSNAVVGSGCWIMIVAHSDSGCVYGASAVGKKGTPSESVGEEAAASLVQDITSGGCVDHHLQDQLVIYMALARGHSTVRTGPLTEHTLTAIQVAEQMTKAKFKVTKEGSGQSEHCIIECEGIGKAL